MRILNVFFAIFILKVCVFPGEFITISHVIWDFIKKRKNWGKGSYN